MQKLTEPNKIIEIVLVVAIFVATFFGVYSNVKQEQSVDRSKIPEKVENSTAFQRWITNLKNKGLEQIDADEFRMREENEIYNTRWLKIYSFDDPQVEEKFYKTIENHKNIEQVIFSPSEQIFVDYRNVKKGKYEANQVHLYGLKEDKVMDARIVDCSVDANCYFDRAYFLNNDVFVITEFSRDINDDDNDSPKCLITELCEYTIKLHLIDLINNSRLVYESKPFSIVLSDLIPEL